MKCSLEAEPHWLHNLQCERGWLLPISTNSFQLGHFLLPSSPYHFLQVASVIQLALGEASCAHTPNPKMAGLTLTCRMTLQRRQFSYCVCSHLGAIFSCSSPSGRNVFVFMPGLSFIRPVIVGQYIGNTDSTTCAKDHTN